ncbi:MAG: O-antigen ligase family protein [Candidatus Deferrimicrobium sp.]
MTPPTSRTGSKGKWVCLAALAIVSLMYEGFYILPDDFVVPVPGLFRISDALAVIVLLSFTAWLSKTVRILRERVEASLLVLTSCLLFFVTAVMAEATFGQPILTGWLYLRHSYNYLLFFMFSALLETEEEIRLFLWLAAGLVALLAGLALLQKYFPTLPIFNFRSVRVNQYFDKRNIRFGEYRLFFPAIEFAFLLYFLMLADVIRLGKVRWLAPKLGFLCLVFYVVVSSFTRAYVLTMIVVTLIAFIAGRRRSLKIAGAVLLVLGISAQLLSHAVTREGIELFERSSLGKIAVYSMNTKEGSIQGRVSQNRMYVANFLKSPLLGVGTLQYNSDIAATYRKFGFYNNNDLGYTKVLAEYGIVGILWVCWFYSYVFRRARAVIKGSRSQDGESFPAVIGGGVLFFFLFVAISMATIPHFIEGDRILPIVLAVVFLEVARHTQPAVTKPETVP